MLLLNQKKVKKFPHLFEFIKNLICVLFIAFFLVAYLIIERCTYCDVGQGGDVLSFYQGQRSDAKVALEKQSNNDPRPQSHEEDMDIGYEDNPLSKTFESIDKKFYDDLLKLAKEQADAEDAENARHREVSMLFSVLDSRSMLLSVCGYI